MTHSDELVDRVAIQLLLAREGLDCDLAMVSEYERHLARTAIAALRPPMTDQPRFFIDHGQIHDKVTGRHVTTDEDSVFCDGINSALGLLNRLDAEARAALSAMPGHELRIGDFVLRHSPSGVWIGRTGGEGGEFAAEHVEHVIAQFYRENF